MKSKIFKNEKIKNKTWKFNEALEYYPCYIDNKFALFTETDLERALTRGKKNIVPEPEKSIFNKLIGGLNR
jgi:hypothetical protein